MITKVKRRRWWWRRIVKNEIIKMNEIIFLLGKRARKANNNFNKKSVHRN